MLRRLLSMLGGEGFGSTAFSLRVLLKYFFFQKILGFNRNVPWPVHWTSNVKAPEKIQRGNRCPGMSMGCHIDGRNGIRIGNNVWVGPHVSIISMNHDVDDYAHFLEAGPIVIGDNCWLATNVVILPGVQLGAHTVVAAGSVVTKSFPHTDQLIGGVPARVLRKLDRYKGAH